MKNKLKLKTIENFLKEQYGDKPNKWNDGRPYINHTQEKIYFSRKVEKYEYMEIGFRELVDLLYDEYELDTDFSGDELFSLMIEIGQDYIVDESIGDEEYYFVNDFNMEIKDFIDGAKAELREQKLNKIINEDASEIKKIIENYEK